MSWISAEFSLKRAVCLLKMSTSLDAWLAAEINGEGFLKLQGRTGILVISIRER